MRQGYTCRYVLTFRIIKLISFAFSRSKNQMRAEILRIASRRDAVGWKMPVWKMLRRIQRLVYTWDSYVGVYVCRYDLRGLLQRQRGTTRVLTEDTIDSSLLFGPCHDITSRLRPSRRRYRRSPYRSKYTSRGRLLHSGCNGASQVRVSLFLSLFLFAFLPVDGRENTSWGCWSA